jgi:hypothetical protein
VNSGKLSLHESNEQNQFENILILKYFQDDNSVRFPLSDLFFAEFEVRHFPKLMLKTLSFLLSETKGSNLFLQNLSKKQPNTLTFSFVFYLSSRNVRKTE